jgi:hypothetical protein
LAEAEIERRVQALLQLANHEKTPQAEAETALAMAYRLMMKYEINEGDLVINSTSPKSEAKIEQRRYETVGPYRVRRESLRVRILNAFSCASYRDFYEGDNTTVVTHAFGLSVDLDAAEVLYAAAELLAIRVIPWGDRGFRTSWWHGFTDGVTEKLRNERKKVEKTSRGVALALRDRESRASAEMRRVAPDLVKLHGTGATWEDAYQEGRQASSAFSTGGRSVGGITGALPRGR